MEGKTGQSKEGEDINIHRPSKHLTVHWQLEVILGASMTLSKASKVILHDSVTSQEATDVSLGDGIAWAVSLLFYCYLGHTCFP